MRVWYISLECDIVSFGESRRYYDFSTSKMRMTGNWIPSDIRIHKVEKRLPSTYRVLETANIGDKIMAIFDHDSNKAPDFSVMLNKRDLLEILLWRLHQPVLFFNCSNATSNYNPAMTFSPIPMSFFSKENISDILHSFSTLHWRNPSLFCSRLSDFCFRFPDFREIIIEYIGPDLVDPLLLIKDFGL